MFFFYHVKWNFQWNWREVVTDQSSTHCLAQYFHHPLVSELKYDVGTNQHVLFQSLCKAANQNQWPVWEMGVCSDSNWKHSKLRWQLAKAWRQCLIWFRKQSLHCFAAPLVANEMSLRYLKAMQWPALTGRVSIFDFKNFWAICLCKQSSSVLQNNHPYFSITRSWRSVLNFKLSVFIFWGQWAAWWALRKNGAKWKYFISNLCPMW